MTSRMLAVAALLLAVITEHGSACTNFLITKGATRDNTNMISYSADSHVLYGELYYWPEADYPENTWLEVYEWDTGKHLGRIPQVRHTYKVVGNMNEHQLAIGETTFGGRPEIVQDTTAILDYGSLIYIALQRAKTAREAIQVMTSLANQYGYYSSGESFSIADKNEVWIMEMIGKGIKMVPEGKGKNKRMVNAYKGAVWVALRIPDGYISGHANHARITTFPLNDPENCLYAPDVISYARERGFYDGSEENFSFSDVYAPVDFEGARFCEARVWSGFNKVKAGMDEYLDYITGKNLSHRMPLWIKPDKKLSLGDVFALMRDYYQNTPLDMTKDPGAGPFQSIVRWRPLTWTVDGATYFNERAISTQQTGFSFIAQCRSNLPDPIGGILWFGVDDTYSTVYSPMYCGISKVPESFAEGNGSMMEFNENAAFWVFNQVSNFAYTRYCDMIPEIQKVQQELENTYIQRTPYIDEIASKMYKDDPNAAISFLTDYSVNTGNHTVAVWKKLYAYLFTKYMDGNIKTPVPGQKNPQVKQPGYSQDFYRTIIRETGDKFRVPGNPVH
ncbi:MAG TPA: C69 family dipeptidase [Bacteroidales bacterium]|nr:C69 family dipeptidase [Bacteroidales bacterium]